MLHKLHKRNKNATVIENDLYHFFFLSDLTNVPTTKILTQNFYVHTDVPEVSTLPSHLKFDAEQFLERSSIVQIEYRINNRIQSGIYVAQPCQKVNQLIGRTAPRAKRLDDVQQKERHPARNEHAHYNAERSGGASFLGQ